MLWRSRALSSLIGRLNATVCWMQRCLGMVLWSTVKLISHEIESCAMWLDRGTTTCVTYNVQSSNVLSTAYTECSKVKNEKWGCQSSPRSQQVLLFLSLFLLWCMFGLYNIHDYHWTMNQSAGENFMLIICCIIMEYCNESSSRQYDNTITYQLWPRLIYLLSL